MNSFWRYAGAVVGVLTAFWVTNKAFVLLSSPSDIGVVVGVAILLAVAAAVFYLGPKVLRIIPALAVLLMGSLSLSGCAERINAGNAGIKVNLTGSKRGIDDVKYVTGWVIYWPFSTQVYEFPTFQQVDRWTGEEQVTFQTADQMQLPGEISLAYKIRPDSVVSFFREFRINKLQQFTHGYMRNVARDAFNEIGPRYHVEEVIGAKMETFLTQVRDRINNSLAKYGVEVEQLGFTTTPKLPPNLSEAIQSKLQAIQDAQRVENELRVVQAEAAKQRAAADGDAAAQISRARGEAEANRIRISSLTTNLIEWRRLELQQAAIAKWNGQLPGVNGGGTIPFIQVTPK